MLKILLFLYPFSLLSNFISNNDKNIKSIYDIKKIVNRYDIKETRNLLYDFVKQTRPSRFPGGSGHTNAKDFIVDYIKRVDFDGSGLLTVDNFSPDLNYAKELFLKDFKTKVEGIIPTNDPRYTKYKLMTDSIINNLNLFSNVTGKNIIWEKIGRNQPKEMLIIICNYDSVAINPQNGLIDPSMKAPGADDNASGVVVALRLIEYLSQLQLPKTVRVVFTDFQEFASLGAKAYIEKYHIKSVELTKNIKGVINLLMLGHDTKEFDRNKKLKNFKAYGRSAHQNGAETDKHLFESMFKSKNSTYYVNFEYLGNGIDSGDHFLFWEKGIPAIVISQNWETDYNSKRNHTPNDFPETLNYNTLTNVLKSLSQAILIWSYDK